MRFDYSKWKGPKPGDEAFLKQLMDIYRNLLLQTGGDVDEALRWMEHFGREYGFFGEKFSIEDFKKMLEDSGEVRRTREGFEMTPRGERRIRQDSLNEIFSSLRAGAAGDDAVFDREVFDRIVFEAIDVEDVRDLARGAVLRVEAQSERTGVHAAAQMQTAGGVDGHAGTDGSRDRHNVPHPTHSGDLVVAVAAQFDVLPCLLRASQFADVADDA